VLAESAIDYVAVLPFTSELASWGAERFVDEVLVRRYRVAHVLMGADHGFGRNREGNVSVLRQLGEARGFTVEVLPSVQGRAGQPISSTRIRRAIAGGDLDQARDALGRAYSVNGTVVHGEKRGRLLGFPTINVPLLSPRKLLPPTGVYAAVVQTSAGPRPAMLNLGPRPTFGDETIAIEANLLGAEMDLYGAHVRIDFHARIRDTRRFDSVEELKSQLTRDAASAKDLLKV
jgi:riboflavin kinase/FMN adenylyltransferase